MLGPAPDFIHRPRCSHDGRNKVVPGTCIPTRCCCCLSGRGNVALDQLRRALSTATCQCSPCSQTSSCYLLHLWTPGNHTCTTYHAWHIIPIRQIIPVWHSNKCTPQHWLFSLPVSLTLWRPLLPYGYSYKASCAKLSFVIFDIRALWRSGLSVRVHGCQKLQMTA